MEDDLLLRYSRQILLPEVDLDGQVRLTQSKVLLVGVGGLGSVVGIYLAAAGVGSITLVDHDKVELSNLQRQIAYSTSDIGSKKVNSAKKRMLAINPTIEVEMVDHVLAEKDFSRLLPDVDLIVDATDNFESRFLINRHSLIHKKPLVSGAAIRLEGQVTVFNIDQYSPCYRCLYNEDTTTSESCSENGVIAPLLGIIGSIQAMETLKILAKFGTPLNGRLLLLDSGSMEWHSVKLRKDAHCPACSNMKGT